MLDSIIRNVTWNYRMGSRNSNQFVCGDVADYIVSNYDADWDYVYRVASNFLKGE